MPANTRANRAYPSLGEPGHTLESHAAFLRQVKEALEIHERRTGEKLDSFVRLRELVDLRLAKVQGQQIVRGDAAEISTTTAVSSGGGAGTDDQNAAEVPFSNGALGISATNVQSAIEEVAYKTITRGATWIDPSGAAVATPAPVVHVYVPKAALITGVTVLTLGGPGNCVIDIWKDVYGSFPPTVADTITAAAKPTISAGVAYRDTTLSGWTTAVAAGDTLAFNLDSTATFTAIFVQLDLRVLE